MRRMGQMAWDDPTTLEVTRIMPAHEGNGANRMRDAWLMRHKFMRTKPAHKTLQLSPYSSRDVRSSWITIHAVTPIHSAYYSGKQDREKQHVKLFYLANRSYRTTSCQMKSTKQRGFYQYSSLLQLPPKGSG